MTITGLLAVVKKILKELLFRLKFDIIFFRFMVVLNDLCLKRGNNIFKFLKDIIEEDERQNTLKRIKNIGSNVTFGKNIFISKPNLIAIGSNVTIGDDCYFLTEGGVVIGDNAYLDKNITVLTRFLSRENAFEHKVAHDDFKTVIIGANATLNMNVNISPGVKIGDGAVIPMGETVKTDIGWQTKKKAGNFKRCGKREKQTSQKNHNGSNATQPIVKGKDTGKEKGDRLFFVVSTGRSGSLSISNILSQHPDILCRHELNRQLIRLSTEYAHNKLPKEVIREYLEYYYRKLSIFDSRLVVGESNLKIGNMIDLISEILPECKFIWLVRNGKKFVASATNRGWFSRDEENENHIRHQWSKFRINGLLCGDLSKTAWQKMTVFEKNCWYWTYWNTLIQKQLAAIDPQRYILIRIESIQKESEKITSLLNVSPYEFNPTYDHRTEDKNYHYQEFDEQQEEIYKKWCQPLMRQLYGQ